MEAELLCISTSMVKTCPQLPLLPFCCLQGSLLLCTGINSHSHTSGGRGMGTCSRKGSGNRERLWAKGKPKSQRTSDGSQHVCRPRGWSLESLSGVGHCKISGGGSQAGELARCKRRV